MSSLIIYSSTDGQTKKICETIIENSLNKSSFEILRLEDAFNKELEKYDRIVIGESIRYEQTSGATMKGMFFQDRKKFRSSVG